MTTRTPLLFSSFIGSLALVALLPFANAQTTGSTGTGTLLTGSGAASSSSSVMTEAELILQRDRKRRLDGFAVYTKQAGFAEKTLQAEMKTFRDQRMKSRVDCREQLRRSNRDEQLPVTLQCLRAELTLERQLIQAQMDYVDDLPGIPAHILPRIKEPLLAMHDALNSFVTAIDKNVFDDMSSVLEARGNLQKNYRVPAGEAMTMVRADRALYWTTKLLDLAEKNRKIQNDATGQKLEGWENAIACLTYGDTMMRQVLLPEETSKRQVYRTAASDLQACTAQVAAIPDLATGSSSSK